MNRELHPLGSSYFHATYQRSIRSQEKRAAAVEGVSDPYQGNQRKTEDGQDVEGRRSRNRAAELRRARKEGPLLTSSTATRLFPSGRMNLIKIDEIGSLSPSSAGREERRESEERPESRSRAALS